MTDYPQRVLCCTWLILILTTGSPMAQKYSIDEIDAMRSAISASYPDGTYNGRERAEEVERRLRTYMQHGSPADEVISVMNERRERHMHESLARQRRLERLQEQP